MAPFLVLLLYPVVILVVARPAAIGLAHRIRVEDAPLQTTRAPLRPGVERMLRMGLRLQATREALQKEFEERDRWLLIGKLLLAATLLFAWMKRYGFSAALLGVFSRSIRASAATGLIAGALLICGKLVFQGLIRRILWAPSALSEHPQSRGPVLIWLITLVVGGTFEEPWRAACLLACREAGWSQLLAVTATSVAFVVAQESGFPARIRTDSFEEVWVFLTGVFLAVLFLDFGTILIPFVASLSYSIANLALVRRAIRPAAAC